MVEYSIHKVTQHNSGSHREVLKKGPASPLSEELGSHTSSPIVFINLLKYTNIKFINVIPIMEVTMK